METNQKRRLALLSGERRTAKRQGGSHLRQALLKVEGVTPLPVVIHSIDLGSFVLLSQDVLPIVETQIELEVEQDGDLVINGSWLLVNKRQEGSDTLSVFEHPLASVLRSGIPMASPDTFLRKSRYRILDVSKSESLNEIGSHYTELKDFPVSVDVVIHIESASFSGKFDFSSERKSLNVLEFQVSADPDKFNAGTKARVEYTHLGVRYAFSAGVDSYDKDFGILAISSFSHLVAITARRFDRHSCDIPVKVHIENQTLETKLSQISPTGAQLTTFSLEPTQSGTTHIELEIPGIDGRLLAYVVHRDGQFVGIRFEDENITRKALHELFVQTLPKNIVAREKDNYLVFQELFKSVGYGPKNETDVSSWENETNKSWEYQDSVLPGNCTGGVDDSGSVVSSAGTLPIAAQVAYGHSLCMVKTVDAAATVLGQLLYSMAMLELVPGIKYYAGSFGKQSRFTTRLQVILGMHPSPDRQFVVHSHQLFPTTAEQASEASAALNYKEIPDTSKVFSNPVIDRVVELLSKPHSLFKERHHITTYALSFADENGPCAIVLKSDAGKTFTAAGMFSFVWIFATRKDVDLNRLCIEARRLPLLSGAPFQIISFDGSEPVFEYTGTDKAKPAFWTITEKDDLGPVIAATCRAVYAIVRKYGEPGLDQHTRAS